MAYIGSRPDNLVTRDSFKLFRYSATAGQTVFTGSDLNNQILSITPSISKVNMNGILLDSSDYTITSNTLTLAVAANAGDEVTITGFEAFEVSDTVSKSSGGIFSNPVTIDAAGSTVLTVDRATSDGTIIDVQKSGSSVGSIGTQGGDKLTIGNGDVGVAFNPNADSIYPWNTATNAARDAGVDLGYSDGGSTNIRFRDLYLSGGVFLGGVGSANKLSDYETGTWTPVLTTGTAGFQNFTYTKIGRAVQLTGYIHSLSGWPTSGIQQISGLPFTGAGDYQMWQLWHGANSSAPTGVQATTYLPNASTALQIRPEFGNPDDFDEFSVSLTYITNQ